MKIILELSEDHARVVQDACEMLMRMRLGQTMQPTELMLGWPMHQGMSTDEYCIRRDIAYDALKAFLTAVGCREGLPKDEMEMLAYEVWGTIRHAVWQHENPDTKDSWDADSWDVRSQEPLSESGKPMPVCRVED